MRTEVEKRTGRQLCCVFKVSPYCVFKMHKDGPHGLVKDAAKMGFVYLLVTFVINFGLHGLVDIFTKKYVM